MQPSIIDLIPGDDGYSDLKRINIVTGLTNRSSNITSYDDLKKLGNSVQIFQSDIYYNLPNPADGQEMFGYYKGVQFRYFNFGINTAGNATAPIYHVNSDNGTLISAILSTVPGLSNYSGIWTVYDITAEDKAPITSFSQVSNLEQVYSGVVANCPVSLTSFPRPSAKSSAKGPRQ
ncbi:18247_t:CDS:2 [Racocetra fulgida]|uniref:18247_t:CDS:1 n=1 Tax=Racocetra fulgida TaxID=60492 RepID=A0A9N9F2R8_9GLOM|nr:18247_t:CDS:2 [Racocetra fulgida]